MSPSVPLVEDRLRHTVASLESLHRLASFTTQPHEIPLFADLPALATAVVSLTRAVRLHIDALVAALPETCRRIAAPGHHVIALPAPEYMTYLQGDDRDIFERLDKQAQAFGVLAHVLDFYINEVPHVGGGGGLLSDMATLVRAEGQSTLQRADEIDALAQRIQKEAADAQARAFRRSLEAQQPTPQRPTPPTPDEKGGVE